MYINLNRLRDIRKDRDLSQKDIAKLVGHENMQVISAISIGYPDQKPNRRPRKELKNIMEWYNG